MKNKVHMVVLCTLMACNCPDEGELQSVYNGRIDKLETEAFKLPDSINTKLIIATCQHPEFGLQTIFMFCDTSKKNGTQDRLHFR
jgi:hypothetical protein